MFCKDILRLLEKEFKFCSDTKKFYKDTINKKFEDFVRRIKLRAHLKNKKNKNLSSETDRFKKLKNKK